MTPLELPNHFLRVMLHLLHFLYYICTISLVEVGSPTYMSLFLIKMSDTNIVNVEFLLSNYAALLERDKLVIFLGQILLIVVVVYLDFSLIQ